MADYDFHHLSFSDFEALTRDLLQAHFAQHIESFKAGRDKGIDLRYTTVDGGTCIIQCKHWAKSGFSALKSSLKNSEKEKIDILAPDRYILSTSVPLSPGNKDELKDILAPHVRNTDDLFGKDDLNNLLSEHSTVERKHFKLWIESTTVLQHVINSDIFSLSEITIEDIRRRVSMFVVTPAFTDATRNLEEHGACLLTGDPGVGKTTIAEMLLMRLAHDGWTPIVVTGSASEALKTMKSGERQVFLYDDFLGVTSAHENMLGKNEERKLDQLIKVCQRTPNSKRIIMTTRGYILATARNQSEGLSHICFSDFSTEVDVLNLDPAVKAHILANHLYFYDVPRRTLELLSLKANALSIIGHQNYNPRIVQWMCRNNSIRLLSPSDFLTTFVSKLDDPSGVWAHIFSNQLSDIEQCVLLSLISIGSEGNAETLRLVTAALLKEIAGRHHLPTLEYRRSLKVLEGTFISISNRFELTVRLHNPSFRDFLKAFTCENDLAQQILAASCYWAQVEFLLLQLADTCEVSLGDDEIIEAINRTIDSDSTYIQPNKMINDGWTIRNRARIQIAIQRKSRAILEDAIAALKHWPNKLRREWCVTDGILLFQSAVSAARRFGVAFDLNTLSLANWILSRISEPHEFVLAYNFFLDTLLVPEDGQVIQWLRALCHDFFTSLPDNPNWDQYETSVELEEYVTSAYKAAELLDVAPALLETAIGDAEDALREIREMEDYETNAAISEWKDERQLSRVNAGACDDDEAISILRTLIEH